MCRAKVRIEFQSFSKERLGFRRAILPKKDSEIEMRLFVCGIKTDCRAVRFFGLQILA